MSFLSQKSLPRRSFLRGMSATIALPYLDAMEPAGTFLAKAAGKKASSCNIKLLSFGDTNNWI